MKQAVYFILLLAVLASCKKEGSVPTQPLAMSAVINGQPWEANAGVYKAVAQVDPSSPGTASQYGVEIRGASGEFLPLGLETLEINIGANYLPKVGRHPINYGSGGFIGPSNPNYRQLFAYFSFRLPNGLTTLMDVSSGFLEITTVTNTQVTGIFELTGNSSQPSNGASSVLHVQNGKFRAQIIGTGDKKLPWDA